ncbi:sulfotransferase [Marinobacteraceae bacterium S3BR75-40.1]
MKSTGRAGPDFICIGAQKAGTTWLYDQLIHHPEVWLPVIKELHYFNFAKPHPELAGVEGYPWGGPFDRMRFLKTRPTIETFNWLVRYNFMPKGPEWYRNLFPIKVNRARGEMTPAYSTLDRAGVEFVHSTVPKHCKVFLILRDPIERAWSGLKMNYRWRGEQLDEDIASLRQELLKPSNRIRSAYASIIPLWESYFEGRFKVFFYDNLVANPEAFLQSICRYLEIDETWQSPVLDTRSNADNKNINIPSELYESLLDVVEQDLKFIRQRYGTSAPKWAYASKEEYGTAK